MRNAISQPRDETGTMPQPVPLFDDWFEIGPLDDFLPEEEARETDALRRRPHGKLA